ncbi:MAG TPA: hypothetical protein PLR99_32285, partial [Polyangiaceae bacterium]|nr:hypothetical protein [Polyangiaceae bacterium]
SSARRVYVLRGGEPVAVDVRAGLTDGTSTEVLSGDLREGDLVVLDALAKGVKPAATAMPGMTPARGGGGRRSGI